MDARGPCGNEDCDLCYPAPRWIVSTESVRRVVHKREIKAPTAELAKGIYDLGTAWPSSYDQELLEVVVEKETQVHTYEETYPDRVELRRRLRASRCYHNLDKKDGEGEQDLPG